MDQSRAGYARAGYARADVYNQKWPSLKRKLRMMGSASEVTLRKLSLGARDSTTGWRAKSYTESTIDGFIIPRSSSHQAFAAGTYVRSDALLFCCDSLSVGDEVKGSDDNFWEVKAIREAGFDGNFSHRECDLTYLPFHAEPAAAMKPPVLWLKFDEGDGTHAADSSGQGNHGTLNGGTWVKGHLNGGLQFDGTDDYVEVSHDASLVPTSLSIMCWVKINSNVNSAEVIAKRKTAADQAYNLQFGSGASQQQPYHFLMDSAHSAHEGAIRRGMVPTDDWHWIGMTFDGATSRTYLDDGYDEKSLSITQLDTDNTCNLRIGESERYNIRFNGVIDDVRIYDYALTAAQMRTVYWDH